GATRLVVHDRPLPAAFGAARRVAGGVPRVLAVLHRTTREDGARQRVACRSLGEVEGGFVEVVPSPRCRERRLRDAAHLDANGEARKLACRAVGGAPRPVPRLVRDRVERGRPRAVADGLAGRLQLFAHAWIARALDDAQIGGVGQLGGGGQRGRL